jgi:hypothetical protein
MILALLFVALAVLGSPRSPDHLFALVSGLAALASLGAAMAGFSRGDANRIGRSVRDSEHRNKGWSPVRRGRFPAGGILVFPVKLTEDLDALSGTTPGTAEANPATYDDDTNTYDVDTSTTVNVNSNYSSSVDSGTMIWVVVWGGGNPWLLTDDCPSS